MAGKFEIYQDKLGQFRFRLKAGNGEIILASEGFDSKSACINAIEAVKISSGSDSSFERKQTVTGKFFFSLKAENQQLIGSSQSYKTESGRDNGVMSVKKNAPTAMLNDVSLP